MSTTDESMCPNCVTPRKCNGPHEESEIVEEPFRPVERIVIDGLDIPGQIILADDHSFDVEQGRVTLTLLASESLSVIYKESR